MNKHPLSQLPLRARAALASFAMVLVLVGCTRTEAPKAPTVVRISSFSTAIDYSPYLVARAQKWFEDSLKPLNATVSYTTFETLPAVNESFATNRLDAVFEAEPPAIIGKAAGIDIRIVGISCSLTQEIVVPPKSSIKTIRDLKGKKIAVLAGTSSHYGLLKLARTAGLTDGSFQVLDLRPPDAKSAFEAGKVDAWAVWPPWEQQEVVAGTGRVLSGGDAQIQSILAARGGFEDQNRDLLCALTGTLQKAKKWIIENPKQAQEIVAKELNLSMQVVELAWPKHDWNAELSDAVKADIQQKATFLKEKSLVEQLVSVDGGFVQTPACAVH